MTFSFSHHGLRVDVVSDLDALTLHAAAWDALTVETPQQLPMMSHAWAEAGLRHLLKPGESWRCLLAYDGERLVGALPVIVPPPGRAGLRLTPLRSHDSWTSGSADVLLAAGEATAPALRALLAALGDAVPGYTSLYLSGIREGSPTLAALRAAATGQVADVEINDSACLLRPQGTYETYRQKLSSKLRKDMKKARTRLWEQGPCEAVFLNGGAASVSELEPFAALEASGWKGREGTAIRTRPGQMDYYTSLCENLARRGWLEWHFLRSDGRNIAARLAIRCGANLILAKVAYDEAFARFSPAWILFEDTVQRAFADGCTKQIDLLSNYDYMRVWELRVEPYHRVWLYPKRPLSLMLAHWRRYKRRKTAARAAKTGNGAAAAGALNGRERGTHDSAC